MNSEGQKVKNQTKCFMVKDTQLQSQRCQGFKLKHRESGTDGRTISATHKGQNVKEDVKGGIS